jgi:predicted nucleic acid-binding protein
MKSSWLYFDSSAYLKLYVKENGSEEAKKIAKKNRIISSAILLTECYSAISRKKKMGEIKEVLFYDLTDRLKRDLKCLEIVRLTDEVLRKAEEIALNSTVRAMDALHVASALIFLESSHFELSFVTSDGKQEKAARVFGLKTFLVS